MEKTRRLFLISMIIIGLIFTACTRRQDTENPKSNTDAFDKPPTVEFEF